MTTKTQKPMNWALLILSCILLGTGVIGGPLISRLYYLHGGSRRWIATSIQTMGFPILIIPLIFTFFRHNSKVSKGGAGARAGASSFFIEPKLFIHSAIIGVLLGLDNFLYSLGMSYIPVSTSSLLFSTQLSFTAFFAWVIVKQRFTAYSINSLVLMSLGAIMLGMKSGDDVPKGVTSGEYLVGFCLTLGSAALLGLIWPFVEVSYSKSTKPMSYSMVLQFQLNVAIFATKVSTTGMFLNNDFQAMGKEATEFGLGSGMYYVVLIVGAVVWQLTFVGSLGVIFCTGSLFNGIMSAVLLPLTEVAAVIAYNESFNSEKFMALALCLWGFTSYFYGEYKTKREIDHNAEEANKDGTILV